MSLDTINIGGGQAAAGAAPTGNPVRVAASYNSTAPAYTTGQTAELQTDAGGNLKTTLANGVASGTAGSPSTQVLSAQGISGGTPMNTVQTLQTSGGPSEISFLLPATPAVQSVKSSAGQVYTLRGYNNSASWVYLKWFDTASAVTLGSTTATGQEAIPPGGVISPPLFAGKPFTNKIQFAVTGGISLTDNTSIGASAVIVNVGFQ